MFGSVAQAQNLNHMEQPIISQFPANVTMSGYGHAMSLPELPDSQTGSGSIPASSVIVQNMTSGEAFTVDGYVVVAAINAIGGDNRWWHAVSGYYVPVAFTVEQPASNITPLTTPPSITVGLQNYENTQASLSNVFGNGLSTIESGVKSTLSSIGIDATSLMWLIVAIFVIYVIIRLGVLRD
jgi:hypothetical protein